MEASQLDPVYRHQTRPGEPELDLYTIPSQSSWFVWDEIHETERVSLREFFNGSSISRTPKIYKEYRDFIINKYREEFSRKLRFTEVRKSLVGDVNLLRKVFVFLENWGLINFSAAPAVSAAAGDGGGEGSEELEEEGRSRVRVRVEEGVPNGIRVAATPSSMKPISAPPEVKKDNPDSGASAGSGGGATKLPPLASYSDVFAGVIRREDVAVCGNCGDCCDSGHYEYTKEADFSICVKCFESGNYGENKTVDDYKFIEGVQDSRTSGALWSEAETLLLLESVLKYGDDWELVAQNLPTKTKLDCISKLIELPLGDVLGSAVTSLRKATDNNTSNDPAAGNSNSSTHDLPLPTSNNQDTVENGDQNDENASEGDVKMSEAEQNGDLEEQGPPLKLQCIASFSVPGGSLMEQASRITTMVEPHIAAAAADAAINSLCDENSWPREIFDDEDVDVEEENLVTDEFHTSIADSETARGMEVEGLEMDRGPTQPGKQDKSTKHGENDLPLTLRIRTAVATALGAAAARAKLLADQEEREIELLLATIIRTEVKKLQCKIKHFDDIEAIMKKKRTEMEEIEDVLLAERIDVLQATFKAGVSGWKNHSSVNS